MRDVSNPPRGAPVHPRVPRPDVVIKYGGAAMERPGAARGVRARRRAAQVRRDATRSSSTAAARRSPRYMEQLGLPVEFVSGLRVTDEATVEVAKMVLVGKVNKDIVLRLNRHGQPAVGLCGRRRRRCSASRARRRRAARTSASSAGSSASTSTSSDHIAQDYIPVDRVGRRRPRGQLLQRQRRRGGRRGRARAARLQGDVPDRRRRLAARSRPTRLASSPRPAPTRSSAALPGDRRRHAAEAAGLPRRDPRRRHLRAHRRRPRAALAAAGAVHRRGHRHQDQGGGMSTAELRRQATSRPTYARYPVEFVRGEGVRLWDADGNEYLDFLAGISVSSVGHCHPAVVEAIREQAGAADPRRQPLLHRADGAAGRPPRGELARRAASSSATPARRPTRRRSSSRARPSAGGDDRRRAPRASTAARWAR